jgi:hypothetical protein
MASKTCALGAAGIAALMALPSAMAQETGLDGLHAQRREGNRICMSDHFHHGSSSGHPTRKQAEAAAIRDWAGFTAWEYGLAWGSYAIAASKSMKCVQSGKTWGCELDARPCKRAPARR